MLNAIVRFSLRFRGIIIALAFALLGYGIYVLGRSKYDVFPEFAPPVVMIQTEAPGLAPEQVEQLVTTPVEIALNGLSGIDAIRSGSIQGVSAITVAFRAGTDVYRARQLVAERLESVQGRLPEGVHAPVMTPLTSSTSTILALGLTSSQKNLMDLRAVADWTIRLRLLAVPGVANVETFGGEVKQFQIQFSPQRLIQYNLALGDIMQAAKKATGILGAGIIENNNQRFVLQTIGQAISVDQIASTVLVHEQGANVTLGQVARVAEGPEPPFGAAAVMGKPGIVLMVIAQYGANTLEVTQSVERVLRELQPSLRQQGIEVHEQIFRPANFINTAIKNIRFSLILGGVLVIMVLFLFLFNFRTAAISCSAIPLSLLAAVTVMERMGFTLNTMTLGGLAIAIGEIVDDAVIDVENIYRRLRENRKAESPKPGIRVVFDASIEVRSAVVYATFTVVLVFVPILTMTGLAGRIFSPLGIAYILSILASLLVALTVTPALSLILLGDRELKEKEAPVVQWLKESYGGILELIERVPRLVIGGVVALTMVGVFTVLFFKTSFLPEFQEGHFILHMTAVPGTSLSESLRVGHQVTERLLAMPFIRNVAQRAGRAEASSDVFGAQYSEFEIDLDPNSKESRTGEAQEHIRNAVIDMPGVHFAMNTFLTERIEETISGYRAAVVVNVFGDDLDALDRTAKEITKVVAAVPGATEVQMQSPPGAPQVAIELHRADVARWGFDPVTVLDAIHTAFEGSTVGQVYQGPRVFDVAVILGPEKRRNIAEIANIPLRNSVGQYVTVGQLATIYESSGRYIVLHDGARRVQTITANVQGRAVKEFMENAQKQIDTAVRLPVGMSLEFGGTAVAQAASTRDLLVHSALAGFGIVALLSIVMMNYRNLLLVLANIPFALVGGVLAVLITGRELSLGPLVGFITLFGITLRNSIMLISHYEHLIAAEGMTWGVDAAVRGASERIAPILMTATVTGLGLLPLAIGSGAPGREIEGPMAIVILGGLFTSTALNLLVLPTLALRYGKFEQARSNLQ